MGKKTYGQVLRELRTSRGLTQEKVAEIIGVSHNTYARYELEQRVPTSKNAMKLADFYGVSMSRIFREEDDADTPVKPASDEEIRFALSSGDKPITWAQYQEVKQFAKFIQERDRGNI